MAISAASYNQRSVPARFQLARQSLVNLKDALGQKTTTETVSFEAQTETRVRYKSEPVYSSRPTYETQDVYTERDVTEERPVYETRPTYTDRPIYETKVTGTRNLSGFRTATEAGIDDRADFSIQVGSAASARVQFTGLSIAVTRNGTTQTFAYGATGPTLQAALTSALSSITGVLAELDGQGHLTMTIDGAQSVKLAEVANEALDVSGTALDKLGLTAGTTNPRQTGTLREQNGTEEVQTGTQTVVVGRERVKTGSQQVATGSESYVSGTREVEDGTESVVKGYKRVVSTIDAGGMEALAKQASARQALVGLVKAAQKDIRGAGIIGLRITEGLSGIISLLGSEDPLTSDKLDIAVKTFDKARAAYVTSALSGTGGLFSKLA